ncbi:MAG: L,D-transpeptidase family protein [Planctomycetes bacterium]|nr:L,D-transpeptidase family protein [Planctomycetota bacterium]
MRSYSRRSSMSRRRRKRKMMYIFSLILLIFITKKFTRNSDPATAFGGADQMNFSIAGVEIQDSIMAPVADSKTEHQVIIKKTPKPTAKRNKKVSSLIENITDKLQKNSASIIDARNKLNETLSVSMNKQQTAFVKQQLSELSKQWLFSRNVFAEDTLCKNYKVKPGDRLAVIGKTFNVPYQILMRINNINDPKNLRAGEIIKVINGPFHCKISRKDFTMDLYLQDTYVTTFPVGLGKQGMETPTGRWVVKPTGKLISPTWTDPMSGKTYQADDPAYPLGARWIGLKGIDGDAKDRTGFAIHGTKSPDEVGTAISQGCIRLYNGDEILLYDMLTPAVSQVIVVQ